MIKKRISLLSRALTLALCGSLLFSSILTRAAAPEGESFGGLDESERMLKGSEFTSGAYPGASLMPVNLWGAVGKSGIHHVPARTNLLTLLSFGGGPTEFADLTEATLRRQTESGVEVTDLNIKKLMRGPASAIPVLQPNDVVYIPRKEELISNNTLKTVTFISAIAGIVLTGVLTVFYFKNINPQPGH